MKSAFLLSFIINITFVSSAVIPFGLSKGEIFECWSTEYTPAITGIDSVEIKLINWDTPISMSEYYAIDRKAFDQTFEYLKNNGNNKLSYLKLTDSLAVSLFEILLNVTLEPFPSEGVIDTPTIVFRNSNGFDKNNGIITNQLKNKDPLEVRGKLIIYTNCSKIEGYFSNLNIDILNHRYRLGNMFIEYFFMVSMKYKI